MIRFWLRCSAVFVLIFVLMIVAFRIQPRDDRAMRAFFTPQQGCAAPCFLGIRPGVTTREEALALLKAHPWVGEISERGDIIGWIWNGEQPAFLQIGTAENQIFLSFGSVDSVYVPTETDTGT